MKVVVTRAIDEAGLRQLREEHEVEVHDFGSGKVSEDDIIEVGRHADALLTILVDPMSARVLEACDRLKVVAQFAVGYDNIDIEAARRRGVVVTHTPGVLTDATADLAFSLLLAVARRIPEADRYVRQGEFVRWETDILLGAELRGKTLGIVGLGRIGSAMARRALGFGMKVIYSSRSPANPTLEYRVSAARVPFDRLLRESDFVSLHCALNEDSYQLLDASAFEKMKASAYLINTARGAVVDEAALVEALERGEIAGAGLDVFENEPQVHPGLLESERVVLAPHIGSATVETRRKMARMCADSILAALRGDEDIPYRLV